jgi:hypothetical protein
MQRNCHEFIAYENLIGGRRGDRGARGPSGPAASQAPIEQVMPLMRRALKMLSDREVTPQLGLLKSTLLQLDSTFSERTYGVSSFRDFAEKLAAAGFVTLRESGRNILVELKEDGHHPPHLQDVRAPQQDQRRGFDRAAAPAGRPDDGVVEGTPVQAPGAEPPRMVEAIAEVRRLFQSAPNPPRWPMYVRQVKQFLRGVDPTFDERKFGFASLNDLLRACQKEGLFRMERDRQGVVRFFQGNVLKGPEIGRPGSIDAADIAAAERLAAQAEAEMAAADAREREAEVVEGDVVREVETQEVVDAEEAPAAAPQEAPAPAREPRRKRTPRAAAPKAAREPREKKAAKPRAARKKAAVAADA